MINESTCTNPICAKHNGHHSFFQVLLLFLVEYLSSCQSLFSVDPHAHGKFGSHPSFFILPSSVLIHLRHCVGEHCFGFHIDLSEHRICSKGSVVHEDFPEFFQYVFSQLHRSWAIFHCLSTFSRLFPSCTSCVSNHVRFRRNLDQQAWQLHLLEQVPKTSFLSPFPWRLPGVYKQTLQGAQGSMMEQIRYTTQQRGRRKHV